VFCVVSIIVRLFNTFNIIDICVLCVWHDSTKEIYYYNVPYVNTSLYGSRLHLRAVRRKINFHKMEYFNTGKYKKSIKNVVKEGKII